jgi:DNA gyrase subunit B
MKTQLLELGLRDSVFDARDGKLVAGEEMSHLCRALASMEDALLTLERRGISLREHAVRVDEETGKLPVYHVFIGQEQHWCATRKDLDLLLAQEEQAAGRELKVSDTAEPTQNGNGEAGPRLHIVELHEVRSINSELAELAKLGFSIEALLPVEMTGSLESRYVLRRGETEIAIEDLRGLLAAVRRAGEKGLQITRFKGLGEMNAEELRITTLDPAHRLLQQVTMDDVAAADDLFRVLMGDKVEPRREFIETYALEVQNLDV